MSRDLVDDMGGGRGRPPRDIGAVDGDQQVERIHLHDLKMVLHYDTGKAILASDTGEEAKAVWLPRSKIEVHNDGTYMRAVNKNGQHVSLPVITVTIPEWLAKEKGLI